MWRQIDQWGQRQREEYVNFFQCTAYVVLMSEELSPAEQKKDKFAKFVDFSLFVELTVRSASPSSHANSIGDT